MSPQMMLQERLNQVREEKARVTNEIKKSVGTFREKQGQYVAIVKEESTLVVALRKLSDSPIEHGEAENRG